MCVPCCHSDHYTPLDSTAIPTGEIAPVVDTPFDFTEPHPIKRDFDRLPCGYDHNYVLFGMGARAKFIVKNGVAGNTCAQHLSIWWPC
jgi:aldose 1-epimerase